MENNRTHTYQFCFVILLYFCGGLFVTEAVGENWILLAFILPAGLLFAAMNISTGLKCGGLARASEFAFGKFGIVVMLIFATSALATGGAELGYFSKKISETIAPEMDAFMLIIPIALAAALGGGSSQTIGRLAVIIGAPLALAIVAAIIIQFSSGNFLRLIPINVESENIGKLLASVTLLQFGQTLLFANIATQSGAKLRKPILFCAIGSLLVLLFSAGTVMLTGGTYIDGPPLSPELIGTLKILGVSVYFFGVLFRLTLAVKFVCDCSKKPIFKVIAAMLIVAASIPSATGILPINEFLGSFAPFAVIPFGVLPVILFATVMIKSAKGRNFSSAPPE